LLDTASEHESMSVAALEEAQAKHRQCERFAQLKMRQDGFSRRTPLAGESPALSERHPPTAGPSAFVGVELGVGESESEADAMAQLRAHGLFLAVVEVLELPWNKPRFAKEKLPWESDAAKSITKLAKARALRKLALDHLETEAKAAQPAQRPPGLWVDSILQEWSTNNHQSSPLRAVLRDLRPFSDLHQRLQQRPVKDAAAGPRQEERSFARSLFEDPEMFYEYLTRMRDVTDVETQTVDRPIEDVLPG
jgi:hypothetical protein